MDHDTVPSRTLATPAERDTCPTCEDAAALGHDDDRSDNYEVAHYEERGQSSRTLALWKLIRKVSLPSAIPDFVIG